VATRVEHEDGSRGDPGGDATTKPESIREMFVELERFARTTSTRSALLHEAVALAVCQDRPDHAVAGPDFTQRKPPGSNAWTGCNVTSAFQADMGL